MIPCVDKSIENIIDNTSLRQILVKNHDIDAKERKIKGQLSLEHIFGF